MATLEKRGSEGSDDHPGKAPAVAAYSLDERRRAALAEVDNAKFSCVSPPLPTFSPFYLHHIDGSISKCAWLPASASLPMRMSFDHPHLVSSHLIFPPATTSLRLTSHRRCWAMSTGKVGALPEQAGYRE